MLTARPVLETDLGTRLGKLSLLPSREPVDDALTIGLELGADAAMWVDLPSRSVSILAGAAEGIDFAALPETLCSAVLEMAVAPLVGPLSTLFKTRVAIADSDRAGSAEGKGQVFLDLRDRGDDTIATLRLEAAACGMVQTALEGLVPAGNWRGTTDLPIQLSAEIAAVALSVSELSRLRTGDLVLLPAGIDPSSVSVRAGGRIIAAGTYDDGKVEIAQLIGGNRMDEDEMNLPASEDETDLSANEDEADLSADEDEDSDTEPDRHGDTDRDSSGEGLDVDQLEVSMCFGLGTIVTTIADLRKITEGYTFSLPPSESGEVVIAVSGQEIGRGEIVQIDDRLGVRITKLDSARHE